MGKLELQGLVLYERDLSNDLAARRSARMVLDHVNLTIEPGAILGIVGPTGCGKTVLLKTIAGLLFPTEGRVVLDGKDIMNLKPGQRGLSMVFQDYALYPTLTSRENIGFRLSLKKTEEFPAEARVQEIAQLLGVQEKQLLDRKPKTLSLGEKQRVAIGKAIAVLPPLVLFDEPLSNIDERFRHGLRHSLRKLLKDRGTSAVYVSHSQTEIAEVADQIAVMNDGRIEQVDKYLRLYEDPRTFFVSMFIGERTTNFFKPEEAEKLFGRRLLATIRPEECSLTETEGTVGISGKVVLVENFLQDRKKIVFIEHQEELFGAEAPVELEVEKGETVIIRIPPDKIKWFQPEGLSPARVY